MSISRFCNENPEIIALIFEGNKPTLKELQDFLNHEMKLREE